MMAYGFQIRDSSGTVVVDDETSNLGMSQKLSLSGSSSTGKPDFSSWPGGMPFIECPTNTKIRFATDIDWGGYSILKLSGGSWVANSTWPIRVAAVASFDDIPAPTGYGIIVRNDTNDLTFTSAAPLIAIRQVINGVQPNNTTTQSFTISSNVTHIFLTCAINAVNLITSSPPLCQFRAPTLIRTADTTVTVQSEVVASGNAPISVPGGDATFQIVTARVVW